MQRLAIDVREAAGQPAGKGRYIFELAKRLPQMLPEVELTYLTAGPRPDLPALNVKWHDITAGGIRWHRAAAELANQRDAYFAPTSFLTTQFVKVPHAITVHDLIAWMPDVAPQQRAAVIERVTLRRAARRADAIIVNSRTTAKDLARRLPLIRDKVAVTPLAADPSFGDRLTVADRTTALKELDVAPGAILIAGTLEPRKGHVTLIHAYAALPEQLRKKHQLVIAGKQGWGYDDIFTALRTVPSDTPARYLDYVTEPQLHALYQSAAVFCYPSRYEGFGLPVLEAMLAGVPVVASNIGSLREVGGDSLRYVEVGDELGVTTQLAALLTDAAARKRQAAAQRVRAKQFSWDQTAQQTAKIIDNLLEPSQK